MRLGTALLGSSAAFVLLALPFVGQPIDSWEWLNRCAGERIVAWGLPVVDYPVGDEPAAPPARPTLLLIHPPSSAYLIASALRLLGDGDGPARVPGLLAVLVTAAVLATLVRRHGTPTIGWAPAAAAALYLVHPAALHGALYLSFSEGTLLPLTWILFLLAWFETLGRALAVRVAVLGLAFALALWAKITTSLALPAAAALVGLATEGLGTGMILGAGIGVLGAAAFLGSWWLYLAHLATLTGLAPGALWMAPFSYLAGEAQVFSIAGLALNAARTLLYLGPFLVLAAGVAIVRRLAVDAGQRRGTSSDIVAVLAVGVSVVYLVLPGGTGSFPKYHLVILPLLAWLAVEELAREPIRRPALGLLLLGVGLLHYAFVVGDPLLLLNHDLRLAQLTGGPAHVLARLGVAAALSLLFPAVVVILLRRWRPAVLIAAAASHLALVLVQAQAGYFTKHLYGTPTADFTRTVALLREATPARGEIVALPEFGYAARRPILHGLLRRAWSDPAALAALVAEGTPAALVYGSPTHTLDQVRGLEAHPALRAALAGAYRRQDVGEFTVWLRIR